MDIFLKAIAGILISLLLGMILSGQGKNFTVLLTVFACCMVAMVAAGYIQQLVDFIDRLKLTGALNGELIRVLTKAVGIGMLSEITALLCQDAGNATLGKITQLLASAMILWLCIPLFSQLIDLIREVLEAV